MIDQIVLCSLYFSPILAQYTPLPRWAQGVSLLENTLYVHGGLSDPFNSYSYSSAPQISDLLVLDLSTSFDSSSPPWQLFSTNSSPALSWHTLSAFNPTQHLLFGGQPGPNSLTVLTTLNDSSGLLLTSNKSSPSFFMESQNWASEPMRRIRHSSSYSSDKVWIIGGEKADGSGDAFSEHYFFAPSSTEFVQLPSSSDAPPDIYGHASLVLPHGRLLVLGGYCASCSELVPMNTVWSLNTTQNPPFWEKLSISNQSLPSPRRDFAAAVLSNGQVLVHGGGDAQLQATYSDGWILDTGQNPMVWNSASVLAQLGQRKDHFAIEAGGYVLFCFGYGSSSPASASLFVYNPATSSMVTSYIAPSSGPTPAVTPFPAPAWTGSNPNSNGGTGTAPPGSSSSSPSYTSGSPSGLLSDSNDRAIAIALGTTFGVIGLVAGGLATIYCMRRSRNHNRGASSRFFPIADDPECSSPGSVRGSASEAAHLDGQTCERVREVDGRGMMTNILAHLGISKFSSQLHQPRKDMFTDEDTRSFGWAGYSTVQRQGSEGTSVWSLRSVGALVRGVIGREPSGSGVNQGDHEKKKIDEGGQEGLVRQGSLQNECFSHPTHRRDGSFRSYIDPFEGPFQDGEYDDLEIRPDVLEKDADYDNYLPRSDETDVFEWTAFAPQDTVWASSVRSHMLTPLKEVSYTSDPSHSLSLLQEPLRGEASHGGNPALSPPPPSVSPTADSPSTSGLSDPRSAAPRHSIISGYSTVSDSTLCRSPSLSRPDTWWSRLTRSPLLDRRTSIMSSKPLDFRDPTPVPLFVSPEETKESFLIRSNDKLADKPVEHDRSLSSARSGRTANTDFAERLGGKYDVIQRLASDGSSTWRTPSPHSVETSKRGTFAVGDHTPTEISPSSGSSQVVVSVDEDPLTEPLMTPKPELTCSEKGAVVASRVRAYERALSRDLGSQKTAIPGNTHRREEVSSRTRPRIRYDVAPRSSLFIANPDHGHVS